MLPCPLHACSDGTVSVTQLACSTYPRQQSAMRCATSGVSLAAVAVPLILGSAFLQAYANALTYVRILSLPMTGIPEPSRSRCGVGRELPCSADQPCEGTHRLLLLLQVELLRLAPQPPLPAPPSLLLQTRLSHRRLPLRVRHPAKWGAESHPGPVVIILHDVDCMLCRAETYMSQAMSAHVRNM